ncbi:MAG: hypothetical protein E7G36_04060 [Peptoniphilus rhinitidis]|uniref:hypothetical protein n=1 Tax=Peptoniphilus rhinitidis TaxID=1175452 RepID=UPI00290480D8|nr:hypothetical protein [Peptoniphilus rhinitidis]MDU2109394.1 hypothetical protein [Peptoniphilus lacydonensis]MDU3750879.1 hypothetical protein [Peptoniphilus rhinitidis]
MNREREQDSYILENDIKEENLNLIKERYSEKDLKHIRILEINKTKFVYDKRKITVTADLIEKLSDLNLKQDLIFIEMRNGGLMFS